MQNTKIQDRAPEAIAHGRRVAHLCERTAQRLLIEGPINLGLTLAAMRHTYPVVPSRAPRPMQKRASLEAVVETMSGDILRGWGAGSAVGLAPQITAAIQILQICDQFDDAIEFSGYERSSIPAAMNEFFSDAGTRFPHEIVDALRNAVFAPWRVSFDKDLPVLPSAAAKLMATSAENLSVAEFESIAAADPVLAGSLLKCANSAAYSSLLETCSLRQAILRMGVPLARKLLLAESFRRVFASKSLAKLWTRSRSVAACAHDIAGEYGYDQDAAFVAGLLHDIGRLLIERSPAEIRAREEELLASGFPGTYAEVLVYGSDHAEIGGELLKRWNLPEEITEAITFHHRPESSESTLASILHLALEDCTDNQIADEHLTAGMRRAAALQRTGTRRKQVPMELASAIFAVAG